MEPITAWSKDNKNRMPFLILMGDPIFPRCLDVSFDPYRDKRLSWQRALWSIAMKSDCTSLSQSSRLVLLDY